jgi:hypothetical protein
MILDAIATHPKGMTDVLMVATDGVYFRSPHTNLDIDGQRLGSWDESTKENLSLFMPGVYWDDKTRAKVAAGLAPELKSRGISASDLAASVRAIDTAWAAWNPLDEPPAMNIPVKFAMVTATQALARNAWDTCGKVTSYREPHECEDDCKAHRSISSDPKNKRAYMNWSEERGFIYSSPYLVPWDGPLESTPYDQTFGAEDVDFNEDFNWETPDGSMNGIIAEALR